MNIKTYVTGVLANDAADFDIDGIVTDLEALGVDHYETDYVGRAYPVNRDGAFLEITDERFWAIVEANEA